MRPGTLLAALLPCLALAAPAAAQEPQRILSPPPEFRPPAPVAGAPLLVFESRSYAFLPQFGVERALIVNADGFVHYTEVRRAPFCLNAQPALTVYPPVPCLPAEEVLVERRRVGSPVVRELWRELRRLGAARLADRAHPDFVVLAPVSQVTFFTPRGRRTVSRANTFRFAIPDGARAEILAAIEAFIDEHVLD